MTAVLDSEKFRSFVSSVLDRFAIRRRDGSRIVSLALADPVIRMACGQTGRSIRREEAHDE